MAFGKSTPSSQRNTKIHACGTSLPTLPYFCPNSFQKRTYTQQKRYRFVLEDQDDLDETLPEEKDIDVVQPNIPQSAAQEEDSLSTQEQQQLYQLPQSEFDNRLNQYDPAKLMEHDASILMYGGLGALEHFYMNHVQFWPQYFAQKGGYNARDFPRTELTQFLEHFNAIALYLTDGDYMTLGVNPLRDTYLCDTHSSHSIAQNGASVRSLREAWKASRKQETLSRHEQRASQHDIASTRHMRLPSKVRQLKRLTVQALLAIENAPISILANILLLQASGISNYMTSQALDNWEQIFSRFNINDYSLSKEDKKSIAHVFDLLIVSVLQWGKQQGQTEMAEARLHSLLRCFPHDLQHNSTKDFSILMADDRKALGKYMALVKRSLSDHTTDADVVIAACKFALNKHVNQLGQLLSTQQLQKFSHSEAFPRLIELKWAKSHVDERQFLAFYERFLATQPSSHQIALFMASALQSVNLCTTDNLRRFYNDLNLHGRAQVLSRCIQLTFLRGDYEGVLNLFETHCRDAQYEFFVRPNMDIVHMVLLIHLVVKRSHSKCVELLQHLTHCDLYTKNLDDVYSMMHESFHKKTDKNNLPLLASAIKIHNARLESMHENHMEENRVELRSEAQTNMYNMDVVYETLNE